MNWFGVCSMSHRQNPVHTFSILLYAPYVTPPKEVLTMAHMLRVSFAVRLKVRAPYSEVAALGSDP